MIQLLFLLICTSFFSPAGENEYYNCEVRYKGYDEKGDVTRTDLEESLFFTYTEDKLRQYMTERDYVQGHVSLSKMGKKTVLILRISIASKNARQLYGVVEGNASIKFAMLDGQSVFVRTRKLSEGNLSKETGYTEYIMSAELDRSKRKLLSKCELDRIGIMWSTGYEQYEIYNLDLLKDQLACLKKQK